MRRDEAGREHTQQEHSRWINRRLLVTAGTGAVFSSPAWAHHGNAAFDTRKRTVIDLKKLGARCQVHAIRHASGSYHVVTADGNRAEFMETNLRFKVDSSSLGPHRGKPVILPTGQVGDRALVFFAVPEEIGSFIEC